MAEAKAVRFDHFGGPEVLQVVSVPIPRPAAGEVVVAVRAAAINPGEAGIRRGDMEAMFPSTLPSGQGTDLARVVHQVGSDVREFAPGDEVLGYSWARSSQATHVAVPATQLIRKPAGVPWTAAGSLGVAGVTAIGAIDAIAPKAGETVAVAGATGGVGTVAVQLLVHAGVRVLGIASGANAEWLRAHGAEPVAYGDGLEGRLRAFAPDAFLDLFGGGYVDLALAIGVPAERIDTIIDFAGAARTGVKAEGSAEATTLPNLQRLADLIATGGLEIPIAATYPLDRVQDAFRQLELRHTLGKIVLLP